MLIPFLISKIHDARVTETNPDYSGSISIDRHLINEAGLREYQQVHVYNISNGNRLITYVIPAEEGSGAICLNGAAAHRASSGDRIIIAAYAHLDERELNSLNSTILIMDGDKNRIVKVIQGKL